MFGNLALGLSLLVTTPATFAGSSTEHGATVTTTNIYDDFCRTKTLPRGNVLEECFFADFRVHQVDTPSGASIYTWDGERTMDAYLNGTLIRHQELSGRILSVSVEGHIELDHRDTCFYVPDEDLYREVTLHIVDGELVIQDVEDVESCD